MPQQNHEIVLFNFPESVFGRRMARYLNLRKFKFSQIRVPPNMPRPILSERLGVNYRRIPLMAIGRDIYIDTRIMLRKLESLYPNGKLGATDSFQQGFEDILEVRCTDAPKSTDKIDKIVGMDHRRRPIRSNKRMYSDFNSACQ
jgi:hypothetical protein